MKDLDTYFEKARRESEIMPLASIDKMLSLNDQQVQGRSANFLYTLAGRKQFRFGTFALAIVAVCAVFVTVFQRKAYVEEEVFIPQAQRRVMHLVKNISDRPENANIGVSPIGSAPFLQKTDIPIHLRSKFHLSEKRLLLLGIRFADSLVRYEGNVKGAGYVSFSVKRTISTSVSVDDKQRPGIREYEFYPWFMTDELGHQQVRYRFAGEPALKMTDSFFSSVIDLLIPIEVDRPGFKKVIFWFSQTPELMSILESAAMVSKGAEISDDLNTDQTKRSIRIEIFPTITKGDVRVVVSVLKKQKLEISLLNSSGEVLQIPVKYEALGEGNHNFSMDLSTFRKGLYFVRIKSDPGVITIHRLFKE